MVVGSESGLALGLNHSCRASQFSSSDVFLGARPLCSQPLNGRRQRLRRVRRRRAGCSKGREVLGGGAVSSLGWPAGCGRRRCSLGCARLAASAAQLQGRPAAGAPAPGCRLAHRVARVPAPLAGEPPRGVAPALAFEVTSRLIDGSRSRVSVAVKSAAAGGGRGGRDVGRGGRCGAQSVCRWRRRARARRQEEGGCRNEWPRTRALHLGEARLQRHAAHRLTVECGQEAVSLRG